ncbi:MAG: hypothetical protein N2663_06980 [Chlorobi bacterium]|nr:hypothetical protein [Chlorobiota bacterium]
MTKPLIATLVLTLLVVWTELYAQHNDVLPWRSSSRTVMPLGQWQRSLDGGRSWETVTLPRLDNSANSDRIVYRKAVVLDSPAIQRAWRLYFGGVCDVVEISVNGQYVGRYFSGQVPFGVALPSRSLRAGRNTIELTAAAASDDAVLQRRLQWHAPERPIGIVRPVVLVGSASAYIERVAVEHRAGDGTVEILRASASVASQYRSVFQPLVLRVSLLLDGTAVAVSEQSITPIPERSIPVTAELRVPAPQRWSLQSPKLYQLRWELLAGGAVLDDQSQTVAFRRIEPRRQPNALFSLDGQPIAIRGVQYVDHWRLASDGTLQAPDYERQVQLLQQLGVNLVYCAWLVPSFRFLDACDRAGIMVLLDLPSGDIPEQYFATEELRTRMYNTAVRMRDAFGSRPCVVGCVLVSNAVLGDAAVADFVATLSPIIREQGLLRVGIIPAGHTVPESLALDALLISDQLYAHRRDDFERRLEHTMSSLRLPWVLLGGALVQPWNRNGYADPLSVEAQAEYVARLYRLTSRVNAAGLVVRSLTDYRTAYPVLTTNTPERTMCYEGLLDSSFQRRLAFEMLAALTTNEPEPLLQAGTYDSGTPYTFLAGGLAGVLLFFALINQSRRFREYLLRAFLHPHNFFMDIRDQRIMLQGQTLLLALIIALTYALVLGTLLYVTRFDPAADYLSNLLTLSVSGKSLYIQLAWSPELAVTVVVLVVLVKIVAVAVILRGIAAIAQRSVFFADALTMVVWALVPIVLFLPLAAVLFRLLGMTPPLVWFVLLAAVTLWGIVRLLRAVAIVFEASPLVVYPVGAGSILALAGIVLGILQIKTALVSYVGHFTALFFP